MTLGQRIQKGRKEAGLSQEELAELFFAALNNALK